MRLISTYLMQGAKAAAAWGVCILLLTAKANTAPMYKSLAAQFDGKLAFGEARSSNQEIASIFGVERCSPADDTDPALH